MNEHMWRGSASMTIRENQGNANPQWPSTSHPPGGQEQFLRGGDDQRCQQGDREIRTLRQCLWNHEGEWPPWAAVGQFLHGYVDFHRTQWCCSQAHNHEEGEHMCPPVFTAALFPVAKKQKTPTCPSADEWMNSGVLLSRAKEWAWRSATACSHPENLQVKEASHTRHISNDSVCLKCPEQGHLWTVCPCSLPDVWGAQKGEGAVAKEQGFHTGLQRCCTTLWIH